MAQPGRKQRATRQERKKDERTEVERSVNIDIRRGFLFAGTKGEDEKDRVKRLADRDVKDYWRVLVGGVMFGTTRR